MHTRRGLTDAEREHRREQDRKRLREAAQQLLSSDGWQRTAWSRPRSSRHASR